MHRKVLLGLVAGLFLLSFALVGCQGGIAQELYDKIVAQLEDAQAQIAEVQAKLTEAQDKLNDLQAEKEAVAAELEAAQAKAGELEEQVSWLIEQYELVGATKAETAENIVRYYHETHEYSAADLFICDDMASGVWNMLKAQGIDAVIAVGDIDVPISDIVLSDHTWVLAEVAPGENLALETTAGIVVPESENPLYYRGWTFDSPGELKSYRQLVNEYNVRVVIRNQISHDADEVFADYQQETNPTTRDKLKAVYDKLIELRDQHEAKLNEIRAEFEGLATKCGT